MKKPVSTVKTKAFSAKKVTKRLSFIFIALMLIVTYVPILFLVLYSFTGSKIIGKWTGFTFSLYIKMFSQPEIWVALGNSLLIGIVSSLFATAIGTAAAVGIFYMRKIPKTASNGVTQITMINADIVTGLAFMLFFFVIKIVPDGYGTLILAHTTICVPYIVLSVAPRLAQLNPDVYEAGLDLGANHIQTFFKVVVPQLASGMIAGFMLAFTISFDDFTISKWINGDVVTVPVYLYNSLKKDIVPELRALSAVLLVIIMAILVLVNVAAAKRAKKLKMLGIKI